MQQRNCFTSPRQKRNVEVAPMIKPRHQKVIFKNLDEIFQKKANVHVYDDKIHEQPIRLRTNFREENQLQHQNHQNHQNHLKRLTGINQSSIILIFIIFLIGSILLAITYYMLSSDSCIKDYQRLECWKQDNSRKEQCMSLEICMAKEEPKDYIEYLVTFGAACILIYKKYQREFIRFLCNLKQEKKE